MWAPLVASGECAFQHRARAISMNRSVDENGGALIDFLIGLCLLLPVFINFQSQFLLNTDKLLEDNLAFPISLFLLPISLLVALARFRKVAMTSAPLVLALSAFFVTFAVAVSLASSLVHDQPAITYGIQWALPFLWVPYFLSSTLR